MAKNSKASIRKILYKEFSKAFPGMRVFVKRGTGFAQWIVYVWKHGQYRDATASIFETSSWNAHQLLEDSIEWLNSIKKD
jgi:hypothetical protein